jgi:acyl-coenzyme A synthetase/AMP-(fatty) acid ligase/acyl carrier protein
VLCQTPSAFRPLSEHVLRERESLPAVRAVIFAGEALDVPSLDAWFGRFGDVHPALVNMYGITETTVHSTYRVIRHDDVHAARVASPIGEPIPDFGMHLVDPALRAVPQGALGEIVLSGPGVARGYLNRPALTAQRFIPELAGDGEHEYIGRLDHQVKIRGFRVELGEIDGVITRHPAVRQAVVLSTRDSQGDVRLVAYVVPHPDQTIDVTSLRAHAATSLPDNMVPAAWITLDRLPLTINGKLDRKALPSAGAALADTGRPYVRPSSLLEELLCDIWKEVLGVERAGVNDDFFALGGHSLKAVQVLHRIKSTLHVDLALRDFFNAPTVAATATAIDALINDQLVAGHA